jgi:hypothetical protein
MEELYDITSSGRIIIKRNNMARHREGNEFGYANVHLNKNGVRSLKKVILLLFVSSNKLDGCF